MDVVEEDDREPVCRGRGEHLPEVGAAHGQDELVSGEVVFAARQRHVDEQFLR